MPENTTTHYSLPYPSGTGAVKLGATDIGELAKSIDTLLFSGEAARLSLVEHGSSVAAKAGELLKMTATATVTLPTPALNAIVGVICATGETTIKMTGAKIFGDFITGAESITLLLNRHVILQSDGTNWYILAGEPLRGGLTTPTIRALNTKYVANATRPAWVTVWMNVAEVFESELLRNGEKLAALRGWGEGGKEQTISISFMCNPGDEWEVKKISGNVLQIDSFQANL